MSSQVAGVILAAGNSQRMGDKNKLLLPFEGAGLVRNVADVARRSNLDPVFAVLGFEVDEVRLEMGTSGLNVIWHHGYAAGQGSSLAKGFAEVPDSCAGAMILMGDMPFVKTDTVNMLVDRFLEDTERWVTTVFRHRICGPMIVPSAWFEKVRGAGGEGNLEKFYLDSKARLLRVECRDAGITLDVNTPQDYQLLLAHEKKRYNNS